MATFLFLLTASPAMAAMVDSAVQATGGVANGKDIETVQRVLEHKIVQEKLMAYGLSPDEVSAKLQYMTDGQVHLLAQASDRVLAGGDGVEVVIGVLVVIILVIIILKLLNKEIIIK